MICYVLIFGYKLKKLKEIDMKKILLMLMSLLLILGFSPIQNASAAGFSDVPASHGFYDEVMYLLNKGVIDAKPKYGVDEKVTRAEVAIMVSKALGLDGKQTATPFKDVPSTHPASGYINSAVKAGIIKGYTADTFKPTGIVNRGEMAIFLARAFKLSAESSSNFRDMSASMASYSSVKKIVQVKITTGFSDNTFRPTQTLTRGQISAFLARGMQIGGAVSAKEMNVHFIDVGQGDSILIQSPNGKTMLIDGGTKGDGNKVVSFIKSKGITKLDYVVATHPDADHIGGLIPVLNTFSVGKFLDSGKAHTTDTYYELLTIIDQKGIPYNVPKVGSNVALDSAIAMQVLHADENASENNDASIVLKAAYNQISFLFTGDADEGIEKIMKDKFDVRATILKAGHHGSSSSTSSYFLNEVKPQITILSYGKDNSYGHPHSEVMTRLKEVGSKMYSTATSGTISVKTNGTTYSVSAQPFTGEIAPAPKPTTGNLKIVSKNLDTEVVAIKNLGTTTINLSGWRLISVEGNQIYNFPSYSLAAGATVYVASGANAKSGGSYLKWTGSYIWNNSGDAAKLIDPKGVTIHELK